MSVFSPNHILITGGSGLIGGGLAEKYAKNACTIYLLSHKALPSKKLFLEKNVKVIYGDITKPNFGLSRSEYQTLAGAVTGILHCAAKTSFTLSKEEAERVNVTGTKHVLEFAQHCRYISQIGILSTAYVSGKRTGVIRESELEHTQGFINEYESSKFRMERYVRSRMKDLPIAVYRLSTVIGNSRTGQVVQFNAVHHALRLLYNGLIPLIPGGSDTHIDLIGSDYAVDAIYAIFEKFNQGKTYHIVSGSSHSLSLSEFLKITGNVFSHVDKSWKAKGREIPPIVDLETFYTFRNTVEKTDNVLFKQIVHTMSFFVPQLSYKKSFYQYNVSRVLAGSGIRQIPIKKFYPRILRYCIGHHWR